MWLYGELLCCVRLCEGFCIRVGGCKWIVGVTMCQFRGLAKYVIGVGIC